MTRYNLPEGAADEGVPVEITHRLTANVGVHVPEIARLWSDMTAGRFVSVWDCQIQQRLGFLGPENDDIWWDVNVEPETVVTRVERDALPFLDHWGSSEAIVSNFINGESLPGRGNDQAKVYCAILLAQMGQRDRANALVMEARREADPDNLGYRLNLRRLQQALSAKKLN